MAYHWTRDANDTEMQVGGGSINGAASEFWKPSGNGGIFNAYKHANTIFWDFIGSRLSKN